MIAFWKFILGKNTKARYIRTSCIALTLGAIYGGYIHWNTIDYESQ